MTDAIPPQNCAAVDKYEGPSVWPGEKSLRLITSNVCASLLRSTGNTTRGDEIIFNSLKVHILQARFGLSYRREDG